MEGVDLCSYLNSGLQRQEGLIMRVYKNRKLGACDFGQHLLITDIKLYKPLYR